VHALRHTTSTYLSRGKVTPRVAQGFMRHYDIKLTMQTYTDHRLLDEAEALDALPKLPPAQGPTLKTSW
jgi:integrase